MSRWGVVLLTGAMSACRHPSPPSEDRAATAPSAHSEAAEPGPVDHLAPGELLAGTESAFGLTLPRGLNAESVFVDVVYAKGPVELRALTAYLRSRLLGGELHEGDAASTFDGVHVATEPNRQLRLHAQRSPIGCKLEIRDVTPPKSPPPADERARWREVGLTPEGRLADPTHLD